jgi:hypothetical protein
LLLGIEKRETGLIREWGPSRVVVVANGVLGATVEYDDERRGVREVRGQIVSCLQGTGIGSEFSEGGEAIGGCERGGMGIL